jgi:hypothetical protein
MIEGISFVITIKNINCNISQPHHTNTPPAININLWMNVGGAEGTGEAGGNGDLNLAL